jgi:hypothetical protein
MEDLDASSHSLYLSIPLFRPQSANTIVEGAPASRRLKQPWRPWSDLRGLPRPLHHPREAEHRVKLRVGPIEPFLPVVVHRENQHGAHLRPP